MSYFLNINCLARVTTDPLRFAKVWIRLYWMYTDLNEKACSKQAARKALDFYDNFLSRNKGRLMAYDEMRVNAILGELSVAVEDYRQAKGYFEANVIFGRRTPAVARDDLVDESLRRYNEIKDH